MRFLFSVFICLLLIPTNPSQADKSPKLIVSKRHPIFKSTVEMINQLRSIDIILPTDVPSEFNDANLEDYYQIYLSKRNALLPEEVRNKLLEVPKIMEIEFGKFRLVANCSTPSSRTPGEKLKFTFRLPIELKGTLLEYVLRIHEYEHAVQYFYHEYIGFNRPDTMRNMEFILAKELNFLIEQQAMLAEWQFLNLIPQAFKDSTHLRYFEKSVSENRYSSYSQLVRNYFKLVLKESHFKREKYIHRNWRFDRYSPKSVYFGFVDEGFKKYYKFSKISEKSKVCNQLLIGPFRP